MATPQEIDVQMADVRAKREARMREIDARCAKHFKKIGTGVYGESGCRTVPTEVKSIPVVIVPEETREDRVARAAARVKVLLGR
jgi:hypothetical protein